MDDIFFSNKLLIKVKILIKKYNKNVISYAIF